MHYASFKREIVYMRRPIHDRHIRRMFKLCLKADSDRRQ